MSPKSSPPLQHTYARTPRTPVALVRASCAASLLLALFAAAPLAAQQAPAAGNANGNANANANAAANDRLRGVTREDSLLGGPAAYRDPYRSALDAGDTAQSDLMRAERVPNGAMSGNGYDPLPPRGKTVARVAGAGGGADGGADAGVGGAPGMAGNAPGGNAAPNAAQAAQPVYRDPFNGAKGDGGQVYRSPW